jgi:hypothetical protein
MGGAEDRRNGFVRATRALRTADAARLASRTS